jgi:hypothetical protein
VLKVESNVSGHHNLLMKKGENPIWIFQNVRYYREKVYHTWEGRSSGVSVRVTKGVYIRTGRSHGYQVDHTRTAHVDTGLFALTTNRCILPGAHKAFRRPYEKIASYEYYHDGIKIIRDSGTAKPQSLITQDG